MKNCFHFLFFASLMLIASCTKDAANTERLYERSITTDESDFEDTTFEADEADEANYITEVISQMKILKVWTKDSLPLLNPITEKKQKWAKRQILSTTAKTMFTLEGYGFRAQSAKSKVLAILKKDTIGFLEIVSWDTNKIVVNFPILVSTANTNILTTTFSLKFKIFVANDIATKNDVSTSKSRASISDELSLKALNGTASCADISMLQLAVKYRKDSLRLPTASPSHKLFFKTGNPAAAPVYTPQRGDIIFKDPGENFTYFGKEIVGVITSTDGTGGAYVKTFVKQSCTEPFIFPAFSKTIHCVQAQHSNLSVRAYRNQIIPVNETDYRITGTKFETYIR